MRVQCAWCNAVICDDDATVLRVSHGICQPCADKVEADARASGERVNAAIAVTNSKEHKTSRDFMKHAWPDIAGAGAVKWNWHLDCICDHLEAVAAGKAPPLSVVLKGRGRNRWS